MPWKDMSIMDQKREFIEKALEDTVNFDRLCKSYGISRQWGNTLLKRYREKGDIGLEARSRKPDTSPTKTSQEIVERILTLRETNPTWGGRKLRAYCIRQGLADMPSEKTINRILKQHGCINPEETAKRKPMIRFEHEHPNDLWQMDFKGHFELTNKQRCHPLTLLDDHSRFSLAIISCANEQKNTVIQALTEVFRAYGLPKRMTMDNGAPWGYAHTQRYTSIDIWLIRLGIKVSHSRPYHPQTQGKLERLHRTLKQELLTQYYFDNLVHAQEGFDWWRKKYNDERPHEAIDMKVPSDRYRPSERRYPETLPAIEFPCGVDVRKVDTAGKISYKSTRYKIGKGLIGQPIGIKSSEEDDRLLDVYYCHQKVLELQKK